MLTLPRKTALAIAAGLAFVSPLAPALGEDTVINVPEDDIEMNAAIARARASLPEFWEAFERHAPGTSDYTIKIEITDKNGTEYFWANEIVRANGEIRATIDNDPEIVRSVKANQRILVRESDIADWMYLRNGKAVRNETLRPLLKRMSPEDADYYRSMLENP